MLAEADEEIEEAVGKLRAIKEKDLAALLDKLEALGVPAPGRLPR